MPLPTVPDWLKLRDGSLKPGVRDQIVFVMIGDRPDYRLDVRPAAGQFACAVTQTINGRRLDEATTYPTADAALAGGLDQLRAKLGW
jgi:hypothetical protein